MDLSKRLFIRIVPGKTFLDRLTGATKVKTFFLMIILLIVTWDMRVLIPAFFVSVAALISIKPKWSVVKGLTIFIVLSNLFNLLLIWIATPNFGEPLTGGYTVLWQLSDRFVVTSETLWALSVRFMKFITSYLVSLTFIQSITPSEFAAGLNSIKVPYKVCTIVSIAFRYIPDIGRDYENIKVSMQARGMELDPKKAKLGTRLKQSILILVPLIISSFDRVGNIANAMDLRGYGKGKTRTYYSEHEKGKGDTYMTVAYTLLGIFIVLIFIRRAIVKPEFQIWTPWL